MLRRNGIAGCFVLSGSLFSTGWREFDNKPAVGLVLLLASVCAYVVGMVAFEMGEK